MPSIAYEAQYTCQEEMVLPLLQAIMDLRVGPFLPAIPLCITYTSSFVNPQSPVDPGNRLAQLFVEESGKVKADFPPGHVPGAVTIWLNDSAFI